MYLCILIEVSGFAKESLIYTTEVLSAQRDIKKRELKIFTLCEKCDNSSTTLKSRLKQRESKSNAPINDALFYKIYNIMSHHLIVFITQNR